jgi:hypothetical protein
MQMMRTEPANTDIKNPTEKETYAIALFLDLCYLYIAKKGEVMGGLDSKNWKIGHFLTTADYFEQNVGYPQGKLPSQEVWCNCRNDHVPVSVNAVGKITTVDDPELIEMYEGLMLFPVKLYKEMCKQFTNVMQKHFAEHIRIDDSKPFGAVMAFKQNVIWKLSKLCRR